MKRYEVTLIICRIEAEDEESAKDTFFEIIEDDRRFLDVTVKEE